MANRYTAEIKVGGEMTAEQHETIVNLMEEETFGQDAEITDDAGKLSMWCHDVWNSSGDGEFPNLMNYLREENIPFNVVGEYADSGDHWIEAHRPGVVTVSENCDDDGELTPKIKNIQKQAKEKNLSFEAVMGEIETNFALPTLIVENNETGKFSLHFDSGGEHIVTYAVQGGEVTGATERGYSEGEGELMLTAQAHWQDENGVKVTNAKLLFLLDSFWRTDAED